MNTVGSYFCTCRPGYADVDQTNPGTNCTAMPTSTLKTTSFSPMSTASTFSRTTTESLTTIISNNTTYTSEMQPPTTCSPSITSLKVANVTATSFCVYWSSQFPRNQSYSVVLRNGSKVIYFNDTSQTMLAMTGLQAGALYVVIVTPHACGSQGNSAQLTVKTDAQTLNATARLTNVNYTSDLENTSSSAYTNLSADIYMEIYRSLPPEMKALVDSGQVRIEITGFTPGSVVVSFTLVFTLTQSEDISNVTSAVLTSLMDSSKYEVDSKNIKIMDRDECALKEHDCSPFATCSNTWGSYTCTCWKGFVDVSPERPGRSCEAATATSAKTTTSAAPTTSSVSPTITTPQTTTTNVVTTTPTSMTTTTAPTTTTPVGPTTTTAKTTTTPAPTMSTTASTTTTVPTTTNASMTTITTSSITTTARTMTSAALTSSIATTTTTTKTQTTTIAPTSTNVSMMTNFATVIATSVAPTTTTNATLTTSTTALTTTTAQTTTTAAPTTATSATPTTSTTVSTTTKAPTTINTSMTTTSVAPTTTTVARTTNTTSLPTSATMSTSLLTTSVSTTTATTISLTSTTNRPTIASSTSNTTTVPTTSSPHRSGIITVNISASGAITVTCNMDSITVTVAKDFLQSSQITEAALYLGMADCGVNGGNSTHAQLTVDWDECNTVLMQNDSYYTASVTLFNTINTNEGSKIRLQIPVICTYKNNMLITSDFGSVGYDMIKDVISGSGMFHVTVQLMNGSVPLPHNYSLSPSEAVLLVVSLNTSVDKIKVVINKCWATPTPFPIPVSSYIFMDNRCSLNPYTTVITNGNSSTSSLSVQIFSFVDLSIIYLHCQVEICVEIGLDSCAPDCLQRASRSGNTVGKGLGTSGPLLRLYEETFEEEFDKVSIIGLSCLGVGLAIFFIIGFVCLFYYQRNRIGNYNFTNKPKEENASFTAIS